MCSTPLGARPAVRAHRIAHRSFSRIRLLPAALAVVVAAAGLPVPARALGDEDTAAVQLAVQRLSRQQRQDEFYQTLLGEMLVRQQQYPDAVHAFLDAARVNQDPALYRRAAEVAWRAGMQEQALSAARKWAELSPADGDARRALAQMYAALNQPREALPYLKRELASAPEDSKGALILNVQRVLDTASDKAQALAVTRELLAGEMTRPEAQVAVARAAFTAGKADEAWPLLQQAGTAKPDMPAVALTAVENFDKDPAQAGTIAKRYALAAPKMDVITLEVLRRLAAAKQGGEAIDLAQQLTQKHPQSVELWLMLGNLRDQAQQADAAEQAYLQVIKLADAAPADKPVLINAAGTTAKDAALVALAASAERRKDYPRAQSWIAQIGSPDLQSDARVRLIGSALRTKDMDTAWKLVNALPETDAQSRQLKWSLAGEMLREQGKYAESMAMYDQAIAAAPDNADLYYDASFTAEKLKRYDRMEALLRKSIALKPHFAQAYNALGYTLADRGVRLDEARTLLDKALSLSPDDAYIIDSMGWLDYRSGRKDDALKQLRRAYALKPDPEIAAHLGEVQWELGHKDDALKTWRSAAAANADNDTLKQTMHRYRVQF